MLQHVIRVKWRIVRMPVSDDSDIDIPSSR